MKHLATAFYWMAMVAANGIAAASVFALYHWPHWWLLGAMVLFVMTLVSYGFLMAVSYSITHFMPMPKHLEIFSRGYLLLVGYPMDYLLNCAVFTVLLLCPPMETTVTERLQKHVKRGWIFGVVARYFALVWINPLELVNRPHVQVEQA